MNIEEFLNNVTVIDVETTDINTDVAEIVELGICRLYDSKWENISQFFGTKNPIPIPAMAIHHITDEMVRGQPYFELDLETAYALLDPDHTEYYIAHNSDFDKKVVERNINATPTNNPFGDIMNNKKWICTWRLAKAVLGVDYENIQYNLSFLRYYLNLDVPSDMVPHRTDCDTYVTAKLLEKLIQTAIQNEQIEVGKDIGQQVYDLCWNPIPVTKFPFGKHKGELLVDIPQSYYDWAINKPLDCFDENSQNYDRDLADAVFNVLLERSES